MAAYKTAVKGTQDILSDQSHKWQEIERELLNTAALFGFKEIRTPTFEYTDLFERSVGDTTDVVNKEMYTFNDKGGRSVTLRPEGTAGVVRAFLEHGLYNEPLPVKACYISSCFRYEKPQAGRYREFHQFGAELFGSPSYLADVEVILLAGTLLKRVGATKISLHINSIGCPACRRKYQESLKAYFENQKNALCKTCNERLQKNPMRILDCKSEVCKNITVKAPKMIDYLCKDCEEHFEGVKSTLAGLNVEFRVNPDIVRGLDYYTRTVFEFITDQIGAQGTVCGGGRYDRLIEQLGGPSVPALGFGMGLERLLLLLEASGKQFEGVRTPELYIAPMGEKAKQKALVIANALRLKGVFALCDLMDKSVKASLKYADKIGAEHVIVLGDSELESGTAKLKNMATGQQKEIRLEEITKEFI